MSSNNLIVQDYLSSLKEDKELDYLFPNLLSLMGFVIVQTAKESKGQSQYGKDIIAIGDDELGVKYRWYFELKGFKDKDITDKNYSTPDGIRESIIEAIDTDFDDSSIPEFNSLPKKIVIVHNGIIKANIRPTLEGFVKKEFNRRENIEFERWDIYKLTEFFGKYMFDEYLLTDKESNRLFKRTLAFLDSPDNDYSDFQKLVEIQIEKVAKVNGRAFKKFLKTLNLLLSIVYHYSKENENLLAAKECSTFTVLRIWAWILENKLEKRRAIIKAFESLLSIQYDIYGNFLGKSFYLASQEEGLYAENGTVFEKIGYPLRSFSYLSDVIYFCELRNNHPQYTPGSKALKKLRNKQKDRIIELVENNVGFRRPILDSHSIPILQVILFFSIESDRRQKDVNFIYKFIVSIIQGLILIKQKEGRYPDIHNRLDLITKYSATGVRPEKYIDSTSMLISTLFELIVLFDSKENYQRFKNQIDNSEKLSLQIAHPKFEDYDIEQIMFRQHMHDQYYIEHYFELPEDFEEFKKNVKSRESKIINFRTDNCNMPFLRTLAHAYYRNEIFPYYWRELIKNESTV